MKKQIYTKSISFILLLLLAFTQGVQASAAMGPVIDAANVGVGSVTAAFSGTSMSKDVEGYIKDYVLNGIAVSLAQSLSTKMTNSIVNWANGGFKGSPSFVNDFERLFSKTERNQGNIFLNEIQAMQQQNPLAGSLARQLAQNGRNGQFGNIFQFTLDKAVGPNWQTFTTGSFNAGGWNGWLALTEPQNNPLGLQMLAENELGKRVQATATAKQQEIVSGGGFLNQKKCIARSGPSQKPVTQFSQQPSGTTPVFNEETGLYTYSTNYVDVETTVMEPIPDEMRECAQYETQTPASTLKDQLNNALNVPQERLTAADEFKEVLSATLTNLVSGLVGVGVQKLKNELNGISFVDNTDQQSDPIDINSTFTTTNNSFGWNSPENAITQFNQTTIITDENGARVPNDAANAAWRNLPAQELALNPNAQYQFTKIEASIYYTNLELEILRNIAVTTRSIPPKFMTLDQCIPGPDFGFQARLKNTIAQRTQKLLKDTDEAGGQASILLRGLDLEAAQVNSNLSLEMLDPTKNLPIAAEALSFIANVRSYVEQANETQSTMGKRQQALTALRIYDVQWKSNLALLKQAQQAYNQAVEAGNTTGMATANEQIATAQNELIKITKNYGNNEQNIGKPETLEIARASRTGFQSVLDRADELTATCQQQRSENNQKIVVTYAQSNMLQSVNLVQADTNKTLYCSIDPFKVNGVLRLISGNNTRPVPSSTGSTFIPGLLQILQQHNPDMEISSVQSTGDLLGEWKNVPLDVPLDQVQVSGVGFDYNLYDLKVTCDRFYRSSLIDYLGDINQY